MESNILTEASEADQRELDEQLKVYCYGRSEDRPPSIKVPSTRVDQIPDDHDFFPPAEELIARAPERPQVAEEPVVEQQASGQPVVEQNQPDQAFEEEMNNHLDRLTSPQAAVVSLANPPSPRPLFPQVPASRKRRSAASPKPVANFGPRAARSLTPSPLSPIPPAATAPRPPQPHILPTSTAQRSPLAAPISPVPAASSTASEMQIILSYMESNSSICHLAPLMRNMRPRFSFFHQENLESTKRCVAQLLKLNDEISGFLINIIRGYLTDEHGIP